MMNVGMCMVCNITKTNILFTNYIGVTAVFMSTTKIKVVLQIICHTIFYSLNTQPNRHYLLMI